LHNSVEGVNERDVDERLDLEVQRPNGIGDAPRYLENRQCGGGEGKGSTRATIVPELKQPSTGPQMWHGAKLLDAAKDRVEYEGGDRLDDNAKREHDVFAQDLLEGVFGETTNLLTEVTCC
jgi:hypothetical protein